MFKRSYAGAQLVGERGGGLHSPFSKIKKKYPDFKKKGSDWVHPYVKFATQNVALRVSKRKNFKIFPCGGFFSRISDEMFIEVPWFHKTFPALKISGFAPVMCTMFPDKKRSI